MLRGVVWKIGRCRDPLRVRFPGYMSPDSRGLTERLRERPKPFVRGVESRKWRVIRFYGFTDNASVGYDSKRRRSREGEEEGFSPDFTFSFRYVISIFFTSVYGHARYRNDKYVETEMRFMDTVTCHFSLCHKKTDRSIEYLFGHYYNERFISLIIKINFGT